jgi:hypothetical protein
MPIRQDEMRQMRGDLQRLEKRQSEDAAAATVSHESQAGIAITIQ